jgi:hypothetical protein
MDMILTMWSQVGYQDDQPKIVLKPDGDQRLTLRARDSLLWEKVALMIGLRMSIV